MHSVKNTGCRQLDDSQTSNGWITNGYDSFAYAPKDPFSLLESCRRTWSGSSATTAISPSPAAGFAMSDQNEQHSDEAAPAAKMPRSAEFSMNSFALPKTRLTANDAPPTTPDQTVELLCCGHGAVADWVGHCG